MNPSYLIYSAPLAGGPFNQFEGSTEDTFFTVINGANDSRRFFHIVGAVPDTSGDGKR